MSANELDDRGWRRLINAIAEKKVVPVIGKELFKHKEESLQTYLNKKICDKLVLDYQDGMSIDQIIESLNNDFGDGKREYCNRLSGIFPKTDCWVPDSLKKLLDTNLFPVILTTSYTPILENYLTKKEDPWGIYAYDKRGRAVDRADIPSTKPHTNVLYYLFGKAGLKGSFVLDEDDLLSFLHFWHNEETRPKELCKYLNDKVLLIIGCDYPDWLFRFMWYSMNDDFHESPRKGQLIISNKKVMEDVDLQSFLRRIKAYYNNNIEGFILELCDRCNNLIPSDEAMGTQIETQADQNEIDFFISYAHEDFDIASTIASQLETLGANVWFDKIELKPGEAFKERIKNYIQKCKRFVPILSYHTIKTDEDSRSRFFRFEWSEAIEESKLRLGIPYITPITIDSVDIDCLAIPSNFKNVHILKYQNGIESDFKELIRNIRR